MDKDTLIETINQIGSCENETDRLTKLTELKESITGVFSELDSVKSENQSLNETITQKDEEIQKANKYAMDMFLKVGEQKSESQLQEEKTGIKPEEEKTYRSYDEIVKDFI